MSIFGTAKSYLVNGVDTIELNKSVTSINFFQNQDVIHRSILTGVRTHSPVGDYSDFTVTERLWQESDPEAKFISIMACEGQSVTFYLHGTSIIALCYVSFIRPFYFNNLINYDGVTIFLTPLRYISISQGYILDDETGLPILDDSGNPMIADGIII
jgi:hypothetical protein